MPARACCCTQSSRIVPVVAFDGTNRPAVVCRTCSKRCTARPRCCCCCSAACARQPYECPHARSTPKVFVNDEPVQIPKGWSVLQACDAAGIDIPRQAVHCRVVPHPAGRCSSAWWPPPVCGWQQR